MKFHFKPDLGPDIEHGNHAGIDALRLDELIAGNIETLCHHFFPEGRRVNDQWRVASTPRIGAKKNRPGSLAINLTGPFTGDWRDWSDKSHGTFVGLLNRRRNLTFQEAVKAIDLCISRSRPVHPS
jgi:hypothetical protein